jgi:sugar lactone lactonase YvrE
VVAGRHVGRLHHDGGAEEHLAHQDAAAPEGAKWTEAPRIVERLNYRQDRQGFNDDRYRHLFVVPATGGTPRQLTDGDWNHNGVEWTPDGQQILFTSMRRARPDYQWRETDIYAVTVATAPSAAHAAQGARQQPGGVARWQGAWPTRATT